jgi:hypothetical protein
MLLPNEITKCVVFICIQETKGQIVEWKPVATGFLVSMPVGQGIVGMSHYYLVTAKHNVVKLTGKNFAIRFNDVTGVSKTIPVATGINWFDHPDHAGNPADVCVTPFRVLDEFDVLAFPTEWFLSREFIQSGEISIGNEVFIAGLFTGHSGRGKNTPIIRVGNIAMLPEEKVSTETFGDMEAYLIEARSIGGVSGSPVFFCPPQIKGTHLQITPKFYLGGLIHGHWKIPKLDTEDQYSEFEERGSINMGIAIVVPAFKILETLMQEALKDLRIEAEKKYLEKAPPK